MLGHRPRSQPRQEHPRRQLPRQGGHSQQPHQDRQGHHLRRAGRLPLGWSAAATLVTVALIGAGVTYAAWTIAPTATGPGTVTSGALTVNVGLREAGSYAANTSMSAKVSVWHDPTSVWSGFWPGEQNSVAFALINDGTAPFYVGVAGFQANSNDFADGNGSAYLFTDWYVTKPAVPWGELNAMSGGMTAENSGPNAQGAIGGGYLADVCGIYQDSSGNYPGSSVYPMTQIASKAPVIDTPQNLAVPTSYVVQPGEMLSFCLTITFPAGPATGAEWEGMATYAPNSLQGVQVPTITANFTLVQAAH